MTSYTWLLANDPSVLAMADRNHVPAELTVRNAGTGLAVSQVVCDQCGEQWPCAIRGEIRRLGHRDLTKEYTGHD